MSLITASLRKAYFVYLWMNKLDLRQVPSFISSLDGLTDATLAMLDLEMQPLAFQRFVETYILNGDGQLKPGELLYLGDCHGVPVVVDPQTGETTTNDDALAQSKNKAESIRAKYADLDLLIMASDTIGTVVKQDEAGEHLGKPCNHQQFPSRLPNQSERQYENLVKAFGVWYVIRYSTSIEISHDFKTWFSQELAGSYSRASGYLIELCLQYESAVNLMPLLHLHVNGLYFFGAIKRKKSRPNWKWKLLLHNRCFYSPFC